MRTHSAVFRDGLSMDKRKLSETDIISKFILPAVKTAGWDDITQICQEVKLRDGKVINQGKWEELLLPIPPLNEQHRIVTKVDELMSLCDQLKARLTDSQNTQLHLTNAIVENNIN